MVEVASELLQRETIIEKAAQVGRIVKVRHDITLKDYQVRKVFREQIGLKYKRIKKLAFQGNNDRSLVLR